MQERHGQMLARVADMSMGLAERLHERAMAAETDEELQSLASAFHKVSRSLRQTLALEARLERDRRRDGIEADRRAAEDRARRLEARKTYVDRTGFRLIWSEAERPDFTTLMAELDHWVDHAALDEEGFLEGSVEDVIERLKRDLGLVRPSPPAGEGGPAEPGRVRGLSNPSAASSRAAFEAEAIFDPSSDLPSEGHLLPQGEKDQAAPYQSSA